jgi:hypothetical protein
MLPTMRVARQFGVARGTVLNWLRGGYLPRDSWVLTPRGYLIDPAAVAQLIGRRGDMRSTRMVRRAVFARGLSA